MIIGLLARFALSFIVFSGDPGKSPVVFFFLVLVHHLLGAFGAARPSFAPLHVPASSHPAAPLRRFALVPPLSSFQAITSRRRIGRSVLRSLEVGVWLMPVECLSTSRCRSLRPQASLAASPQELPITSC